MIRNQKLVISSGNILGSLNAVLVVVLGFWALPAELAETDCPNVVTGPAARNDSKWLSFSATQSDEVATADQHDKVNTANRLMQAEMGEREILVSLPRLSLSMEVLEDRML